MNSQATRVLLIEDNPADATLIDHMLCSSDPTSFELVHAGRLVEGLDILREVDVDVILLDLSLPDSWGLETFDEVQATSSHLPIVVLSGLNDEMLAIEAVSSGAQDYLMKDDVNSPLLIRAIRYAIERKRTELELQQRNRELRTLNAMTASLTRSSYPPRTLGEVIASSLRSIDANGAVFVRDPESGQLSPVGQQGMSAQCPCLVWPTYAADCACGKAAREERMLIADSGEYPNWCHHRTDQRGDRSPDWRRVCLPLRAGGQVQGVMALQLSDAGDPASADLGLFEAVGDLIAVAIERARLQKTSRQHIDNLSTLNRTGHLLISSDSLDDVLEHVITEVRISLEADGASILLYDKETDELVFGACAGVGANDLPGLRMPAAEGLAGWVLRHAQPLLVDDAQDDSRFYGDMDDLTGITTRSLLAVPLIYKGYVIGVMQALNRTRVHFSEAQLEMVSALAGPAAIAIENSRLYQETAQRLAETEILHDTMMAGASTLDFEEMLSRSLQAIQRTLGVQHLAFMLPDEVQEHLVIDPDLIIGYQTLPDVGVKLPIHDSVVGKVYQTGRPELVTDTSRIAHFFRHESLTEMRSEIAVPVRVGNWVIGVLAGLSPQPGAFDNDDLRIFEAIAAQLAVVMEHSRLFEAEREQRKLLEQSQTQLIQSEKLAATGRLAASLAHEINNPLQAIRSGLQLMLDNGDDIDHRPYLEMADQEVERLVRLVSRMLDFAGRPQPEFRAFSLNDLLQEVFVLTGKYLQHSHVALQRDFTSEPTEVWGASDELQQVFLNLLLNAVDAMPEGGTLHISTRRENDGVRASLTDTGLGIAPEQLGNVFEPFFSTKEEGTGLGLSISHQIIDRHRGQISVRSRPNQGTTFSIWLPAQPAIAREQAAERAPKETALINAGLHSNGEGEAS